MSNVIISYIIRRVLPKGGCDAGDCICPVFLCQLAERRDYSTQRWEEVIRVPDAFDRYQAQQQEDLRRANEENAERMRREAERPEQEERARELRRQAELAEREAQRRANEARGYRTW